MDMGFIGGLILIALLFGPAGAREVLVWYIIFAVAWWALKGFFALIDWLCDHLDKWEYRFRAKISRRTTQDLVSQLWQSKTGTKFPH